MNVTGNEANKRQLQQTVSLLQDMIRAACVNDGHDQAGQEIRNARILEQYLAGSGAEVKIYETLPGRASLIARVKGTDPTAPRLALLGHLDVVPVERAAWSRDPFGGELIDGEVWGRGAVDMLFLTASFASVLKQVALAAQDGRPPRGDLLLIAAADEEAGGERGVKQLFNREPLLGEVTEVLGESGGMRFGQHVAIEVGEKGSAGRRITLAGQPGHASVPYGTEGAIERVRDAVTLLKNNGAPVTLADTWHDFVAARVADPKLRAALSDPATVDAALPELGQIAGYAHAVSRTTIAATKVHAGSAHNVIPPTAQLTLDIRTLPGVSDDDVDVLLERALAPLGGDFEVKRLLGWPATRSAADTELFRELTNTVTELTGAPVLQLIAAGGSDCRFFRERGVPAYGFALFSPEWDYERYRARIHAHDERIDVASVGLTLAALNRVVNARIG